jgi:hypothetical protein
MYYADLTLSDVVFLLIVRTILGIIGANLYQTTMYSCVLSCRRRRQGARRITGLGQEFVLPTNEQAYDLAETERLQCLEQPQWVRPVALNCEPCGTATRKHLSITGATRPVRSSCRGRGQTSK